MNNRADILNRMETHIQQGNIDTAKTIAQEFNRQGQANLCFTSRQIKGLRILEDVIEEGKTIDEDYKSVMDELLQIKYTIEQYILNMKCEKYSQIIEEFGLNE